MQLSLSWISVSLADLFLQKEKKEDPRTNLKPSSMRQLSEESVQEFVQRFTLARVSLEHAEGKFVRISWVTDFSPIVRASYFFHFAKKIALEKIVKILRISRKSTLGTKRLLKCSKKIPDKYCKSKLFAPNFFKFFGAIVVFELRLRHMQELFSKAINLANREMRSDSF